jgi:hypothetical protein
MILEFAFSIAVFNRSPGDYLDGLRSPPGAIGFAAQLCFATFPLLNAVVGRGFGDSTLRHQCRLALIRGVHTAIYLVMATSTFAILYAGISGAHGPWLWTAMALLSIESAVFVGNGLRCPLTTLAVQYGAKTGHVFDTFIPERFTRYTFRAFGTIAVLGLLLIGRRTLLR